MQLKFHIDADSLTADKRSCSMAKGMKSMLLPHIHIVQMHTSVNESSAQSLQVS